MPGRPRGSSLSVGDRLSDPLRLIGRPFGLCVRRPSPRCATVVFDCGCPHCDPGHSRGQERGAIDEAVSFTSFDRSIRGVPLRPAPFQRRGYELPLDLLGPRGAFTEYRRSLTLSWSPAGTPESVSETVRCARRITYRLREESDPNVDLQAEGLCHDLPVRVSRTAARKRLPSY